MANEYLETLGKYIRYKKEYVGNDTYRLYIKKNELEFLEKSLQRLEAIDNANPSESLDCIERVNDYLKNVYDYKEIIEEVQRDINTIKQALLKAQEQEKENAEYKKNIEYQQYSIDKSKEIINQFNDRLLEQEKVLEIIKEKSDLSTLEMANDVNEFNEMTFSKEPYTQEEFDLLKRWIEK